MAAYFSLRVLSLCHDHMILVSSIFGQCILTSKLVERHERCVCVDALNSAFFFFFSQYCGVGGVVIAALATLKDLGVAIPMTMIPLGR